MYPTAPRRWWEGELGPEGLVLPAGARTGPHGKTPLLQRRSGVGGNTDPALNGNLPLKQGEHRILSKLG